MNRLSIRWRIALWNTAAFALILLGFGLTVYGLLHKTHYDQLDRGLRQRLQNLVAEIAATPADDLVRLPAIPDGFSAYLIASDGRVIERTADISAADASSVPSSMLAGTPRADTVWMSDGRHLRRIATPIADFPDKTIVMFADLHHVDEELQQVLHALWFTAPIVLVVAASLAYFLAYKALSPVDELRRRTDTITAQSLDLRLPVVNAADELGKLALTINAMIARLENSFNEIRRFTADASHELRTPLSVIRSEAELGINQTDDREAVKRRFASIVEECSGLAELTTQLLTLCRDEAGFLQMAKTPVCLADILDESASQFRQSATAKRQHWHLKLDPDIWVAGDADRLRQVFNNLFDNAVKFTPMQGTVEVKLRAEASHAVVTVTDTGSGIPPEDLPRVFDRFFQVQRVSANPHPGAGLGLSIVKAFVEAHLGSVHVSSTPAGTTFRVTFPRLVIAVAH